MVQATTGERWVTLPDFPDYAVSDLGRVRSYRRQNLYPAGGVYDLAGNYDSRGYYRVHILRADGKKISAKVHRLVCHAFVSNLGDPIVRHLDGDKTNNRWDNLAEGTHAENTADAIRHGTHIHGERHHSNKLTEAEVLTIYNSVLPRGLLAGRYGVSVSMISHIKQRRKWKYLHAREDVAQANLDKLRDRKERGVIRGEGDWR